MFILKKGHQPGVYVPLRALFLVLIRDTRISSRKRKTPYLSLFSRCHRKEMSFMRTYATKSLFSPHNMVCRHISKLHSENHDLGIIIFVRKPLKYLPPSRNFIPKLLIITGYIYVH